MVVHITNLPVVWLFNHWDLLETEPGLNTCGLDSLFYNRKYNITQDKPKTLG